MTEGQIKPITVMEVITERGDSLSLPLSPVQIFWVSILNTDDKSL